MLRVIPQGEINTQAIQEACQKAQGPDLRTASDQEGKESLKGHGAAENQLVEKTYQHTQYSNGNINNCWSCDLKNIKLGVFCTLRKICSLSSLTFLKLAFALSS